LQPEGQKDKVRKFGASTVNKCLTLVSMMSGYALDHEWISSYPASRIDKIKGPAKIDDSNRDAIASLEQALSSKTVANEDAADYEVPQVVGMFGGSGRTRTFDQGIMSPLL
jgi:hypothetical protein